MNTWTAHGRPLLPPQEPPGMLRPLSILLVEDDPMLRRALELSLGHLGHLVISASRAEEVKGMLQGFAIDLIISDHRLPDGTSGDVLHAAHTYAPRTPAIVISGHMTDEEQTQSTADGAAAYLSKPFTTGLLQRAVCKAIGRPL